jgi:hypothetical protein
MAGEFPTEFRTELSMRYMVIEKFKVGCSSAVYDRFREKGRMLPEGLIYIDSWVTTDRQKCYQLMETEDPRLFETWIANWSDLVDLEFVPVMSSSEAASK